VVPFQYFQKALELISTPAEAGMARESPKSRNIRVKRARIVFIIEESVSNTEITVAKTQRKPSQGCANWVSSSFAATWLTVVMSKHGEKRKEKELQQTNWFRRMGR
jgi:hypothetical protein